MIIPNEVYFLCQKEWIKMNNLEPTDDELSVIITSLQYTITGFNKYNDKNSKDSLDSATLQAVEVMKALHKKIESKYY